MIRLLNKVLVICFTLISVSVTAGNLESFLTNLNLLPLNERQAKADSFMNANPIMPLIENDTDVFFIYKGKTLNPKIAGDFTGWTPSLSFTSIPGTDLFYYSTHFPSNSRVEYKFVINGNWILDPKNPKTFKGGMGANSELRMPGYLVPPETSYYSDIPHGTTVDTSFFSNKLNDSRNVKIYLPSGYTVKKLYPVILFHDGLEFISLADILNILDYLIAHHEIEPVIGVFVPPVDRESEYAGNKMDNFTSFIVNELMPVIDQRFSTNKDPRKRATFGISDGGNIALYIGMKHPEIFGKIAAMSSDVKTVISSGFQNSSKMNLEFYMDIGTYDIPMLIPMVNNFIQILQNKNYLFQYKHWNEGHSWGNWKTHVSLPLRQFFHPD
jgi:enterochelin esterase family protein